MHEILSPLLWSFLRCPCDRGYFDSPVFYDGKPVAWVCDRTIAENRRRWMRLGLISATWLRRTRTPTRRSCWKLQSNWRRRASATRRRSTRQPGTWKCASRTLCAGWSRGSSSWTCRSPSTPTPRRWVSTRVMLRWLRRVSAWVCACRWPPPHFSCTQPKLGSPDHEAPKL